MGNFETTKKENAGKILREALEKLSKSRYPMEIYTSDTPCSSFDLYSKGVGDNDGGRNRNIYIRCTAKLDCGQKEKCQFSGDGVLLEERRFYNSM